MAQGLGSAGGRPLVSSISALNVQRRDDALYLLALESGKLLSPYDICKTQVLADVFHVVETGKAIFGGKLYAFPYGPVVKQTLDDIKRWISAFAVTATHVQERAPAAKPLVPVRWGQGAIDPYPEFGPSPTYAAEREVDWGWFADGEVSNIRRAFSKVIQMGSLSSQSQRYFHEPISAIGYAYSFAIRDCPKPLKGRVDMNWFDVLDGAEKVEGTDVNYARAMLGLWI